jgi:hypothetical protein
MTSVRPNFFPLIVGAVLLGCRETVSPGPPPANLVPLEGNGQSAARLDTLSQPLIVSVVDDGGEPVRGVAVSWSTSDPDARLVSRDEVTDDQGLARVTVILGFTAGVQHVEARALGFDDVARFTATATSAPGFKAVSLMRHSSGSHMCALDAEQRAWCWGPYNGWGELGNGSLEPSERPQLVATTERFTALWGAGEVSCGLTPAKRLFCWGSNQRGENGGLFGNGSLEASPVPVLAGGGMSFDAFDLSSWTACGITPAGEAYCWGAGALGNGVGYAESALPVPIAAGGDWREIGTDIERGCVVSTAREVHCWAADQPAVKIGVAGASVLVPTAVPIVPTLANLSMGWYNQCGMRAGYGAVCWGEWLFGSDVPPPGPDLPSPQGETFELLLAKAKTLMGRSPSGRLWIWGGTPNIFDGWVGDSPVALKPAGPWLDFAIGDGPFGIHASDSTVWRWPPAAFGGYPGEGDLLPVAVPAPGDLLPR